MMKRSIAAVAFACLAVTSCTTAQSASVDAVVQKNLPKACAALTTVYSTFVALEPSLKPATTKKVEVAYAGVQPICANPSSASGAGVLVEVAAAYSTITLALKDK